MTKVNLDGPITDFNPCSRELSILTHLYLMIQSLHGKTPAFIGDKTINLSWKEAVKPVVSSSTTAVG